MFLYINFIYQTSKQNSSLKRHALHIRHSFFRDAEHVVLRCVFWALQSCLSRDNSKHWSNHAQKRLSRSVKVTTHWYFYWTYHFGSKRKITDCLLSTSVIVANIESSEPSGNITTIGATMQKQQ